MNNSNEDNKKHAQEHEASLRVTLLSHPLLDSLHRKAICDFEVEYKDYQEKVKSQGSATAKPLHKALCLTRSQREVIALMKGIPFKNLSIDIILSYLKKVKSDHYMDVQLDERSMFKGIFVRTPISVNDIGASVAEFYVKVNDRIRESGVASRLLDDENGKEMRKQCFPMLMKGVWPREAHNLLKKKYEQEGKKWKLNKLLEEIQMMARTHGPLELLKGGEKSDHWKNKKDLLRNDDTRSNSKWTSHKGKYPSFSSSNKPTQGSHVEKFKEKKDWKNKVLVKSGSHEQKRWMAGGGTKKIVCFKCGQPGHKKPECNLPDDHFKVIAHQKKFREQRAGLRKLGINFMVDEQNEDESNEVEVQEEGKTQESEQEEFSSDCDSN